MAKKPTKTQKRNVVKDRTALEWVLLAFVLLMLYILLAQWYAWWPFTATSRSLGTAFYSSDGLLGSGATGTSEGSASTDKNSNKDKGSKSSDSNADGSTNQSVGTTDAGDPAVGSDGESTGDTTDDSALLQLASDIDTGMTKDQLNVAAKGISKKCTVVVNTSRAGKQEVCLYTQGDKMITVTLRDGKVLSASLSRL